MDESLLTEGTTIAAATPSRRLLGNRPEKSGLFLKKQLGNVLQSDDQSAADGLVPLSATIDTRSINFLNKKTSYAFG